MLSYDILIKNGFVVDGAGNPWFRGDVGVRDEKIVNVGRLTSENAEIVIDAKGLVVSPGFIDVHNHSDASILINPKVESMIRQGVTTLCIGNCGLSAYPVNESTKEELHRYLSAFIPVTEITWRTTRDFLGLIEKQGVACNIAAMVGHGAIRIAVMGFEARLPTDSELKEMKSLVAKAMDDGAFGISTGLGYAPGFYSNTEELIELSKVVAEKGGIYATHIRSANVTYEEAVAEAIKIGKKAGIPVLINHIESHYPDWGKTEKILKMINEARAEGLDVTCDVPPYLYSMSVLTTLLPEWAHEGGISRMIEQLKDETFRKKIVNWVKENPSSPAMALAVDGYWDKIKIGSCESNPNIVGMSLAEIAEERGVDPYDAVFDLLIEEKRQMIIIYEGHNEEDIRKVLKHPASMIESDERARAPYGPLSVGNPHPRAYGTFPMIFRKYVRGETRPDLPEEKGAKILTLEEAIRKMTSFPAQRLGIYNRGLIKEGMYADIVIFDPDEISDTATYTAPHKYPVGIKYVIVNGKIILKEGESTDTLAGKVLRGPAYKK